MKNLKTWSGLAFIFISGFIIGSVFSSILLRERVKGFMKDGPRRAHVRILMEVTKDIGLTEIQQSRIDSLIDERMTEIDSVGREIRKTMDYYNDSLLSGVREILTDEQKVLFEQRVKEVTERMEKMRREHRDPRDPFHRPERRGGPDGGYPPPPDDNGRPGG